MTKYSFTGSFATEKYYVYDKEDTVSDLSTFHVEYPTDLENQDYQYNNYREVLYNKESDSNQYLLSLVKYSNENQKRNIFPFNSGLNLPQERYFWSQIRGRRPYNSLFSGKDSFLMGLVYYLLLLELPCWIFSCIGIFTNFVFL